MPMHSENVLLFNLQPGFCIKTCHHEIIPENFGCKTEQQKSLRWTEKVERRGNNILSRLLILKSNNLDCYKWFYKEPRRKSCGKCLWCLSSQHLYPLKGFLWLKKNVDPVVSDFMLFLFFSPACSVPDTVWDNTQADQYWILLWHDRGPMRTPELMWRANWNSRRVLSDSTV